MIITDLYKLIYTGLDVPQHVLKQVQGITHKAMMAPRQDNIQVAEWMLNNIEYAGRTLIDNGIRLGSINAKSADILRNYFNHIHQDCSKEIQNRFIKPLLNTEQVGQILFDNMIADYAPELKGMKPVSYTHLTLPTTIWYALFCFAPMFGIIIAFKNYKVYGNFLQSFFQSEWVGFENFEFLFSSNDIWMIIRNTLGYNIVFIILNIVVPVAAAIAIGQLHNKKMAKAYQTAMFMPYFLSWVVVSALVWAFLSFDKGLVNGMLESFGMDRQQWYMKPKMWPPFLVFMNLWKGVGYGMVVYLATITGIDKTYYEAAGIDGATIWQQIRYITLPLMKTVIVMMFIMAVGRIFYSDFGLFYQVPRDSNSLYNYVYTLDVYVYKQLKTSTTGMAAAAAFVQSVMGCITILTANAIVRKVDRESAMI